MHRTYLPLQVKGLETAARRCTGIAVTRNADRHGDIIDPLGLTFRNPVTLLLYHDQGLPVGRVTFGRPTADGLTFEAEFPEIREPGELKTRVDEAWQAVRAGLLNFVSVGMSKVGAVVEKLKSGGLHFKAAELVELSLVTVPANRDATILTVKALDAPHLAARGLSLSGATEPSERPPMPMSIPDQIDALETRKTNARARMDALLDVAQKEERTLNPDESVEHDAIQAEFTRLDADLARWKERELVNKALAVPVTAAAPKPSASPVITVKSLQPKGTTFTRCAMALLYGKGDRALSVEYAKQFKDTPEVETIMKAAVAVGTTTDATWAAPLVPTLQTITAEFLELLRPATLLGRIPGLVHVPFNVRVAAQTGGGTYGWVGEGLSKPVTKLTFSSVSVAMHKAAGIIVFTEELARTSTPRAEEVVRRDMIAGIAQFLDSQFITASVAEVSGVNPASITNGLTPITSTDSLLNDIAAMFAAMTTAGIDPAGSSLLMSPMNAFSLAITQASGMFTFPNVTMNGGSVVGLNVVTSTALSDNVILIAPGAVLIADEGGLVIDVSREASVQMDSAPATPPTGMVSLWQQNLVGLRAERFISWKRARTQGVQLVTGADYAPSEGT